MPSLVTNPFLLVIVQNAVRKNLGANVKLTKYRVPEGIKIFFLIILFSTVYGYVSDDDYHNAFAIPEVVRYNCDMLVGGWHPDVPPKVIDECRKKKANDVKTY